MAAKATVSASGLCGSAVQPRNLLCIDSWKRKHIVAASGAGAEVVKQSLPTATRLLIGVNAINKTMLLELDAALDDIEKNDSVYTVVINGNGRAFCAGFDLQAGIEANLKGEE